MEILVNLFLCVLVAIISLRKSIFFSAFFTTLATLFSFYFFTHDFSHSHYYFQFSINFLPPLCFLLIAIPISLEASHLRNRILTLEDEQKKLQKDSHELLSRYKNLQELNQDLEKRILKDDSTALKLHEAVERLDSLSPTEILEELLELVILFTRAKSLTYYEWKEQRLYLKNSLHSQIKVCEILDENSLCFQLLQKEKHAITFRDHPEIAMENTIIACMLRTYEQEPIGAVFIHEIDFFDLNKPNVNLFEKLCLWASKAAQRAMTYQDQSSRSIHYKQSNIFNSSYFKHLFLREFRMAKRYKTHASILTFLIDHSENIPSTDSLISTLNSRFTNTYRNVDSVFFNDYTRDRYHVLLPMTPLQGAEIAAGKLIQSFESEPLYPYIDKNLPLRITANSFLINEHLTQTEVDDFFQRNRIV